MPRGGGGACGRPADNTHDNDLWGGNGVIMFPAPPRIAPSCFIPPLPRSLPRSSSRRPVSPAPHHYPHIDQTCPAPSFPPPCPAILPLSPPLSPLPQAPLQYTAPPSIPPLPHSSPSPYTQPHHLPPMSIPPSHVSFPLLFHHYENPPHPLFFYPPRSPVTLPPLLTLSYLPCPPAPLPLPPSHPCCKSFILPTGLTSLALLPSTPSLTSSEPHVPLYPALPHLAPQSRPYHYHSH